MTVPRILLKSPGILLLLQIIIRLQDKLLFSGPFQGFHTLLVMFVQLDMFKAKGNNNTIPKKTLHTVAVTV